MGLFSRNNTKSIPEEAKQKWATSPTMIELSGMNTDKLINCSSTAGQVAAYERCSALATVINRKTQAVKNAKLSLLNAKGDEVTSSDLAAKPYLAPNRFQSMLEFFASVEHFKNLHGVAYVIKTELGALSEYYVVPNIFVSPVVNALKQTPFSIASEVDYYNIKIYGTYHKFSTDEVTIISDIDAKGDSAFTGLSRLIPLNETINAFISSYEAATELMSNRGMLGIISLYDDQLPGIATNVIPQSKADTERVQENLGKYGMLRKQFKYAITNKKANFVPVSSNLNDMGLVEIQNQCKKDIAYSFGVPAILMDMSGGTFSNVNEAQKSFYSDTIIPSALATAETISRMLGGKYRIMPYFDHLECFQQAKQQQASGMSNLVTALNNAVASGLMSVDEAKTQLSLYLIQQ